MADSCGFDGKAPQNIKISGTNPISRRAVTMTVERIGPPGSTFPLVGREMPRDGVAFQVG
jgi:hypothetical protein